MERMTAHFPRLVWLNPEPEDRWEWAPSVRLARDLVGGRMFPLTLRGLDRAIGALRQREPRRAQGDPAAEPAPPPGGERV
jgi:hypothetical protein